MSSYPIGAMVEAFVLDMTGVKSPFTIKWHASKLNHLARFVGVERDVHDVTIYDLRKWRAALQSKTTRFETSAVRPTKSGGLAQDTFRNYVRSAREFFGWLVDEGIIKDNPATRLELPAYGKHPRKGVSESDMRKMIAAAQGDSRAYAMLLFMADTACRASGLCSLKVADLDLENRKATVSEKGLGGDGKPRAVFMEPDTVEAIRAWLEKRKTQRNADRDCDYVFTGKKGRMKHSGVYQIVKRLSKVAGVEKGWNPHNWRHAAARAMLCNGASLAHVSQILGHSDIVITARFYSTFATDELQTAHDRYSWRAHEQGGAA